MTSSKPLLWITRKLPESVIERARSRFDLICEPDDQRQTSADILEMSGRVDAMLVCHLERFDAELVRALLPRLKMAASYSVGLDHCDVEAFAERGIVLSNTPDVLSDATAEVAILLMLAAARRAGEGYTMVRESRWASWTPSFMVGSQISGKRFGVVGMGRVGQVAARRALGFDMSIHYHNRIPLVDWPQAHYHDNIESLLEHSDVLSLHCPSTSETRGLINAERLAHLPEGAIVVNTARGDVVDDDALIDALRSGRIQAAGLDVFKGEPDLHPAYKELDNVFVLPHIGSATGQTREAMGMRALDNLDAFFDGREPGDRVA